jgi:hypothetical protein
VTAPQCMAVALAWECIVAFAQAQGSVKLFAFICVDWLRRSKRRKRVVRQQQIMHTWHVNIVQRCTFSSCCSLHISYDMRQDPEAQA